ncbi:universal stress protein [Patulibacter sp. SYSU D01012]|uniref:universal stress protein n=1 Tax=Patulibacter sp. SYSU D01012 TaxID=2817381 RepID=UPI001B3078F7|nr:universal stress protein [Patulibacter sp. SYSU D01012]
MSTHLVVGHDGGAGGADALALALHLSDLLGPEPARLTVASVYPTAVGTLRLGVPTDYDAALREDAEERLAPARAALAGRDDVELLAVPGGSPARALHELARERGATAIVVGRSHTTAVSRPFIGSVTEQTLHAAPCPVAVAPRGYAEAAPAAGVVAVAYDGSPDARHALGTAAGMARGTGRTVRIVEVVERVPLAVGSIVDPYPFAAVRAEAHGELAQAVELAGDVPTDPCLLEGPTTEVLGAIDDVELLVLGSRGFGPVERVLLGSVSTRVARHAAAPLLVLPHVAA